jgi:hypothetical protein
VKPGAGWFTRWKRDRRAPVLAGAREKDPLATPQSPLTQLTGDELAAAIEEEQRRARSAAPSPRRSALAASAVADAGAQNHAPQRPPKAQAASRPAKKQKQK